VTTSFIQQYPPATFFSPSYKWSDTQLTHSEQLLFICPQFWFCFSKTRFAYLKARLLFLQNFIVQQAQVLPPTTNFALRPPQLQACHC